MNTSKSFIDQVVKEATTRPASSAIAEMLDAPTTADYTAQIEEQNRVAQREREIAAERVETRHAEILAALDRIAVALEARS